MLRLRRWLRRLTGSRPRPPYKGFRLSLEPLEDRTLLTGTNIIAAGVDIGHSPLLEVYDAQTRLEKFQIVPFNPAFLGGVRVAIGDVTGDGVPDVVAAAGPGGGPHVRTYNGVTGQQIPGPLGSFYAYAPTFTGGVFVAVADVNGDGYGDIITGAGPGGGPHVTVRSGKDGTLLNSFYAFAPTFTGGVRVAGGDVNRDGKAELIVSAGPGGGPNVKVVDATTLSVIQSYYAYAPTFTCPPSRNS